MGNIIKIEFDNTLKKSEIVMPLMSSSKAEAGEAYSVDNLTDKAQTAVFGIQVPLIVINSTIISFDAVHHFSLKSEGRLPELTMTVEDRFELLNNIDKPSHDNEVRVQIIPRFDNTYKKIDLTFYINNIKVNGSMIRLSCLYKLPELTSSQFNTFGMIDTYSLFKEIAQTTKLGFASNIKPCGDERYIYCDNKSLLELMNDEIQYSNATEHIIDWWLDFWDNINLADIKERYESMDSDDEIMVWVSGQIYENTTDVEPKPYKTVASISNFPGLSATELFVKDYSIDNKSGAQMSMGSDKVYSVYEEEKEEYLDHLIQDGAVKNDIFTKYEYLGENYGDYNYILAKCCRNAFMQKMNSETIKVTMNSPLLGLMRGHRVNYIRYINDDLLEDKMKTLEENDAIDRNVESNIPLTDYEMQDTKDGKFRIDKTVSGQYLITSVDISYSNAAWDYVLTLTRPASLRPEILKKTNHKTN